MTHRCPECGALLNEDNTCQFIFESFLALEYSNPANGKVHFLTVSCYMIQHNRYSDDALGWIEPQLRSYLKNGIPSRQIGNRMAKVSGQDRRTWKVLRQPGARSLPKITWSTTIADVAVLAQDPITYVDAVTSWAHTVLHEMQPLLTSNQIK